MRDEGLDTGTAVERQTGAGRSRRVDPVSLVAGLIFIAIALAALTDRYWADIDPVLIVGGSTVAVGIALIAGAVLRGPAGRRANPVHTGGAVARAARERSEQERE